MVDSTQENIVVLVSVIDKATAQLKGINQTMTKMVRPVEKIQKATKKMGDELKGMQVKAFGAMFVMRRFSQALFDLLTPAADAFGIFDLWNTMLLVTFAPLMQQILPLFLDFIDFFMGLPEPVQAALGDVTLITAGLLGLGAALLGVNLALKGLNLSGLAGNIAKGVGIVAIAYALVEAKNAFDDFKNGKVINGIIGAMSASLIEGGGIILASKNGSGTTGGALILLGVGMNLVNQGTFFQALGTFVGVLVGLFTGIGEALGKSLMNACRNIVIGGVQALLNTIATMLESNPFTSWAGKQLRGIASNLDTLKTTYSSADAMNDMFNRVGDAVSVFQNLGTLLDQKLTASINSAQANNVARQQGLVSFPDMSGNGVTQNGRGLASFPGQQFTPVAGGFSSGNVSVSPVYNINVLDRTWLQGVMDQNNQTIYSEVLRWVKPPR